MSYELRATSLYLQLNKSPNVQECDPPLHSVGVGARRNRRCYENDEARLPKKHRDKSKTLLLLFIVFFFYHFILCVGNQHSAHFAQWVSPVFSILIFCANDIYCSKYGLQK